MRGFIGMRLGRLFPPLAGHMGDIIVHLLVERHDPAHRAYRDIVAVQQTPDPETSGIGMALLEVIHLDHQREPDFPGCGVGGATLVLDPGKVFGFKAANPQVDRGTGHLQKATDTQLTPPLIVELDHLEAGLIALRVAVIRAQG